MGAARGRAGTASCRPEPPRDRRLRRLRRPGGFGLPRKKGGLLPPASPSWTGCRHPRGGFNPRPQLSPESLRALSLRSKRTPRASRSLAAPSLFSLWQRGPHQVPSKPRQPTNRNFFLVEEVDRVPVFTLFLPLCSCLEMRGSRGALTRPGIRGCGDALNCRSWGPAHSSPQRWKIASGWSYLQGFSVYAGRRIFGIAVARISGLERTKYWGNKAFKSVPSIPKIHRGPEKHVSSGLCGHCQTVCVWCGGGAVRVQEWGLLSKLIRHQLGGR